MRAKNLALGRFLKNENSIFARFYLCISPEGYTYLGMVLQWSELGQWCPVEDVEKHPSLLLYLLHPSHHAAFSSPPLLRRLSNEHSSFPLPPIFKHNTAWIVLYWASACIAYSWGNEKGRSISCFRQRREVTDEGNLRYNLLFEHTTVCNSLYPLFIDYYHCQLFSITVYDCGMEKGDSKW